QSFTVRAEGHAVAVTQDADRQNELGLLRLSQLARVPWPHLRRSIGAGCGHPPPIRAKHHGPQVEGMAAENSHLFLALRIPHYYRKIGPFAKNVPARGIERHAEGERRFPDREELLSSQLIPADDRGASRG